MPSADEVDKHVPLLYLFGSADAGYVLVIGASVDALDIYDGCYASCRSK